MYIEEGKCNDCIFYDECKQGELIDCYNCDGRGILEINDKLWELVNEEKKTLMRIQCPNPDCPYKRNYNKPYTDEANDEFRISSWKELLPLGKIICPFCGSKMIWAIKGKIENGGGSRVISSPPSDFFEDKMMPPPAASPPFAGGR